MTIAQRMNALIFSAFIGLICLSALGSFQLGRVFTSANFSAVSVVPSLIALDKSSSTFGVMRLKLWQYTAVKNAAERSKLFDEIKALDGQTIAQLDLVGQEDTLDQKERDFLKTERASLAAFFVLRGNAMGLADAGKDDEFRDLMLANVEVGAKVVGDLEAHKNYSMILGKRNAADAARTLRQANWQTRLISVLVIAAVGIMGLLIKRRLVRSLQEAVLIVETVSSGDLTMRIAITSTDEFGKLLQALKNMNDSLLNMVGQVSTSTISMSASSNEIAIGNMDLSRRTEAQASSLEETAASMEQLTSTVKQNADNARQAKQLAQTATDIAVRGGEVVSKVVATMDEINDASRKIVDIISAIDGIAFQTNILALNAAVEAARAGEQGRGFAVVATEVRNLAQRSAAAAKEIKELINHSVIKVEMGNTLVNEAGTTMREVVGSIQRVTDIVSEITAASLEQSTGISQVNEAVIQIDNLTQQNAALVEEAAAAAASVQNQAAKLSELVSVFTLTAGSPRTTTTMVRAPSRKSALKVSSAETTMLVAKRVVPALRSTTAAASRIASAAKDKTGDWEEF